MGTAIDAAPENAGAEMGTAEKGTATTAAHAGERPAAHAANVSANVRFTTAI